MTHPRPSYSVGSRHTLRLPQGTEGRRIDRVLAELVPELSRSHWKELFEAGLVAVDGAVCDRPSTEVVAGAQVQFTVAERVKHRTEAPDPAQLVVLYEDDALVVIDKPPGVLAHPTDTRSGATISDLAVARFGPLPTLQGDDRPGIVHRLDAGTSGVMVLARTTAAFEHLMNQFRSREVHKTYRALVYGAPRFDTGWIDAPLERDSGDSSRMVVARPGEGREAQTYYVVEQRFRGLALVAAQPKTGRTHQIRVHLTHAGMPLVGDKLYRRKGGPSLRLPADAPVPSRQCLHAAEIRFVHPTTGESVQFSAPLAADFAQMLAWTQRELA
jgi:23S rRNA pseudouridine1911/1915/1917 synthase